MNRKKVSTLLDPHLFRQAKLESVRSGKQVSEILGEALARYLSDTGRQRATGGVAAETWGVLKLDRRKVRKLIDEEDGWLDT